MNHIGLGAPADGTLACYGWFPQRCTWKLEPSFADDLIPLVEPLACALRAVARARHELAYLSARPEATVAVLGAGPMGALLALAVRRFFKYLPLVMVDPNSPRRNAARALGFADQVFERLSVGADLTFVASSALEATRAAATRTRPGGTAVLFAGINSDELDAANGPGGDEAREWEATHRHEYVRGPDRRARVRLIGSSGYTLDEVRLAIDELSRYSHHYSRIQNVVVEGLPSHQAIFRGPGEEERWCFHRPAVEVFLSPDRLEDKLHAVAIARALKVLIRI